MTDGSTGKTRSVNCIDILKFPPIYFPAAQWAAGAARAAKNVGPVATAAAVACRIAVILDSQVKTPIAPAAAEVADLAVVEDSIVVDIAVAVERMMGVGTAVPIVVAFESEVADSTVVAFDLEAVYSIVPVGMVAAVGDTAEPESGG